MITADAPAACAFCAFSDALQVPRWISATAPAGKPAKSAASQPSVALGASADGTSGALIVAARRRRSRSAARELRTVMPLSVSIVCSLSSGSAVWATLIARAAVDGEPTMNGRSALLPADSTATTPACTTLSIATVVSSCSWPYGLPMDRFMTSMASEMSPSPLGSSAQSMPSSIATLLQEVETEEQTFTTYRSAPGAMPLWVPSALRPAAMSETWVPWPSKSIGFGSGASGGELAAPFQVSPTKSVPPLTFGAFGPKKSAQMPLGATAFCAKQVSYAVDGARTAQVLVGEVDAGVEHRDLHAGAVEALLAHRVDLQVVGRLGQAAGAARILLHLVPGDRLHRDDAGDLGQVGQLAGRDRHGDDVRGPVGPAERLGAERPGLHRSPGPAAP